MNGNFQYDVVIIGGGPAGAATALALRTHAPSLSVALIEQTNDDQERIGETLPPSARPLLEQLGVWQAFLEDNHLPAYGTCAVWGSDRLYDNEFIFQAAGRGWHLNRKRFDARLTDEAVKRGTAIFSDCTYLRGERTGNRRWRLGARASDQRDFSLETDFVVDATGRRAVFAGHQQIKKVFLDKLFGAFVFFDLKPESPLTDTYTLVEAAEEGWWYSAVLPENRLVIVHMTDFDSIRKRRLNSPVEWMKLLESSLQTKNRAGSGIAIDKPLIRPAFSHRLERLAGKGWLAVGDAATTFDPLSSQGILKGLRSGVLASYAIGDYFKGEASGLEKYEAIVSKEFESYLSTRAEFYRAERRWPESEFWTRRYDNITLDPNQSICAKETSEAAFEKLSMHLPVPELKQLSGLCRSPKPAREVVSEFTAGKTLTPARRVILALQYLVDADIIGFA